MRPLRLAAALAVTLAPALAAGVVAPGAARAEVTTVPGVLSTTTVNTSSIDVPVPAGVVPRAITGVLTMPEVVNNGVVTFRVNGRIARVVDSTLYGKVRIPVTAADVVADGTIGLAVSSQGPAIGNICRPAAGQATLRKIALDYRGTETPPTTIDDFFPRSVSRVDVLVPADADVQVVEAGLTAVAALTARYGAETPVELNSLDEIPQSGTASQRIVVLTAGASSDVTSQVTAGPSTGGVPTLTIAGTGPAMSAAARELGSVGGPPPTIAEGADGAVGGREVQLDRTLEDFGVDELVLSGYGSITQRVRIVQDVFATPVGSMQLRLRGAATALAPGERARVDVLVGDDLVGSTVLDDTGALDLTVDVPGRLLAPVMDLDIVLNATTADGTACAAAGVPPLEVQIDAAASTVTATALDVERADFSLFPQLLGGVLPVAIRPQGDDPFSGAVEAARLVAALQRAAAVPFDVQLVRPETLVADDRSGLLVGATAADAAALGAPAMLSAIRPTPGSTLEVTSQEPYAVLQAVEQDGRFVLALGSWAPDGKPAPVTLVRSVVEFATDPGWESLRGDLVIADTTTPPVVARSRRTDATEESAGSDDEDDSFPVLWLVVGLAVIAQVALFWLVGRHLERRRSIAAGATSDELVGSRTSTRAYLEDFEFREEHSSTAEPTPAPATADAARRVPETKVSAKKAVAKKAVANKTVMKQSPNKKKRR